MRSDGCSALGNSRVEENLRTQDLEPKAYLALMFVFYGLAIFLVARANG